MKTKYGQESYSKFVAIGSYIPVRIRVFLVIPAIPVLLILSWGRFLEISWKHGIKDGLEDMCDWTYKTLVELPCYALARLWDGYEPFKPRDYEEDQ